MDAQQKQFEYDKKDDHRENPPLPGHRDVEGGEEQAVDVNRGQDHKRGPAPTPRPIFHSNPNHTRVEEDQGD